MVMLMPGLAKRDNRLSFAIGPRAQVVTSTVLGAPETPVERGVGRAFGRTEAFPDASVVSVVLAESAALVRTIHVVRKELAVPGRLAFRLAGLRRQCAIGKARRPAAAALVRHARTANRELVIEVDVVVRARRRFFGIVLRRKIKTPLGQLIDRETSIVDAVELAERALQALVRVVNCPQAWVLLGLLMLAAAACHVVIRLVAEVFLVIELE